MVYQAYVLLLGVALGTALYCYLKQNRQSQHEQHHRRARADSPDGLHNPWNTRNSNTCTICMEEEEVNNSTILQCGHGFHTKCIDEWIKKYKNTRCPVCRHKVDF